MTDPLRRPTFIFLKNGSKVDEVKGANASGIEAAIRRHTSGGGEGSVPTFPGVGHSLSGAPQPASTDYGYLRVVVIVALIWMYYAYSSSGGGESEVAGAEML